MSEPPYDLAILTGLGIFSSAALGAVASALCNVIPPTLWLIGGACGVALIIAASSFKAGGDNE